MADFSVDLKNPITTLETTSSTGGVRSSGRSHSLAPQGGLSYVRGATDRPLWRKTVWQTFDETAARLSGAEAAVFLQHDVRWTWSQLREESDRLAAGLLSLGLEVGDRLGIWAPNRPEWLLAQIATARIGVILVTVNPAYRKSELRYALNKSGCKAVILAERFKTSDYVGMMIDVAPELNDSIPGELMCPELPMLKQVIRLGNGESPGMHNFADVMGMAGPAQFLRLDGISSELDVDDAINIQFTSGTTGNPKGATLSHENIVNNARFAVETIQATERDKLCIPVPLYHCFGMVLGTLGCMAVGATMVFPAEAFDAESTLAAVASERCTALYGVPTMFVAMLAANDVASHDLSSLRTGTMGGAPCPIEVMKRVVGDMNMSEVTIAYGMTETSPISFQSHIDDALDKRVTTVGRVHPHVEVKIIDDRGKQVPSGVAGELCTRGYSVMRGYWEDDTRTAEAIDRAGWMHSGDLATLDEQGYCNIVGRVKDMLIRGGENIYPREIEEFLFTHPKITEVQVFGVPDEKYGEEVCAWIVLNAGTSVTEEEIREFCKDNIAHFKIPRFIRFKDELPMTVTGKPQKFVMRDEMMKDLGRTQAETA